MLTKRLILSSIKSCIFIATFAVFAFFIGGCSGSGVSYEFEAPIPTKINVTGLEKLDNIVEVFDYYNGKQASENELYVVVENLEKHRVCLLNGLTGEIKEVDKISTYNPEKPYYWTQLSEHDLGGGEKCIGRCLSLTGIGGTTEKYGFNGTKKFNGQDTHKIIISYQYVQEERTGYYYSETAWDVGGTQKIVEGENIVDIKDAYGYAYAFNIKYAWRKARFYPISENYYLSLQPNSDEPTDLAYFIVYDTRTKESWGAQLPFSGSNFYVDGGVIGNGEKLVVITGLPNKYIINLYPNTKEFAKNVKTYRAIQ